MIELRRVESDGDAETFCRLRNEIHPREPLSREAFAGLQARPRRLDVLGLLDGEPVGVGSCGDHFVDPDGPRSFASLRVLRGRRGRGVGSALLERLAEEARSHGRSGLYTVVAGDDEDSLRYFGNRGWERVLEMQGVSLDLGAVRPSDVSSLAGLELVPLAEELDRAVYEAALEVEQDLRTHGAMAVLPFERWHARQFTGQTRRDLSFAVLDGDRVAGYAILEESLGVGDHAITGVRRAYRGRGIGRALKQAQIAAAKAAGLKELRASDSVANTPMRALNERLGYRPTYLNVHLQGPLP